MFAEKTCFNVLCTCKATSLSKIAKLVWRYSDDARAIIENVYKTARRKRIIEPRHEISNNVVCATSKRLRPACAYAQSDKSLCSSLEYSTTVKLQTEHHFEFLSLIGGCTGSSEFTHVKMPHCWKSHVGAHMFLKRLSFGSKECTEELKQECASFLGQTIACFGHLGLISDPLIISKFSNESHDPKGQENKLYTIVKGRETFYSRHTVPITCCSEVKYVL